MLYFKTLTKTDINGEKFLVVVDEDISKGDVVWELDKDEKILTKEEREKLPPQIRKFAFQYKDGYIVVHDGSELMNHSCDPNLWWGSDDNLVARRNIRKGDELTYDYSSADVGDWTASWECDCKSENCRKRITGNDCLDKGFQEKYQGHLPSWVMKYINSKK